MKKGIDVSQWQEDIDFNKVKQSGIDFCIIREGYGQTVDPYFLKNVNRAKRANLDIPAVYHFCYSINKKEVKAQVKSCIKHIKKAKLPENTIVFFDFEDDTVIKARQRGYTLTKKQCMEFTEVFCQYIKKAGYNSGIYSNLDYYKNWYQPELIQKYPFWLAEPNEKQPSIKCNFFQYSFEGNVPGITDNVDLDIWYDNSSVEEKNDIKISAQDIIKTMQSWVGKSRSLGTHHDIIDIYNSYLPRARGYKVTYEDDYCDTTVSAAFIKLNSVDLIGGPQCGVQQHVKLFKEKGIWQEDGTITPKPGYIIVYSWRTDYQPNDSYADHIGIVKNVSNNIITTIEGNISGGVVGYNRIAVKDGNIRGFAIPNYNNNEDNIFINEKDEKNINLKAFSSQVFTISKNYTPSKIKYFVGKVTSQGLYVRTWAGKENSLISSYPILSYNNLIDICDSIQDQNGQTWYYVKIADKYYGFVDSSYIKKV